ncbi:T9SS type A sorting domain-containing protein [Tenacibaculum singaporense]|uniref:T9SS C-terminal target domain-containing protein n=1 Tax=Tenacibaculum singaporense TaxID=2358479 RepID=A0A3S8RAA1_9FLAO|nr:T9SS type A sorting domain-containing protein [Tenacibaculum singaporense]AZJ36643.1 T9SS C-terminal target domain-containing protein [Tenacibaculum singaporense]
MKITRIIVLIALCTSALNAQEKDVSQNLKLKKILTDLKAENNPKNFVKALKDYELLKKQALEVKNKALVEIKEETVSIDEELLDVEVKIEESIEKATITNQDKEEETQKELDCVVNIEEAMYYLNLDKNNEKSLSKAVEYLTPCVESGNATAQLLMARLYAIKKTEEDYIKAFQLLKKSAKQGNVSAMTDLGVLYKYGKGCKLNYNKAIKWFKKAAEKRNNKAAYSLGYMYLKGFGTVKQDYVKAINWFEKSDYPMAKYWLGVCYYYGYGIDKNVVKANEFLKTNFDRTKEVSQSSEIVNVEEIKQALEKEETSTLAKVTKKQLNGVWEGDLLFFDWSATHIENKIPFKITAKYDAGSDVLHVTTTIADKEQNVDFIKLDNSLYFNDVTVELPHISFSKNIPSVLEHQLLSSDVSIKQLNSETYLTGSLETYVNAWKESGVPIRFVLKKKRGLENSEEELSEEALAALSKQEDSFIKLYPNPFEKDLIVSYSLEEPTNTKVTITNINGLQERVIKPYTSQEVGSYQYYVEGRNLPKGVYVVTILSGEERNTRIIIKK